MKIKHFREKLNMTQETLANKLNVDKSAVTKWETGVAVPKANKLPKIAEVLECTIDELFS